MCWPSSGAGRRIAPGVSLSFTGMPSALDRALDRVLELDLHLARLRVRVVEHLRRSRGSARTGTPRLDQRRDPVVGVARGERRLELGDQLGTVRHPVVVGGEARVVGQLRRARSPRTAAPTASALLPPTVM